MKNKELKRKSLLIYISSNSIKAMSSHRDRISRIIVQPIVLINFNSINLALGHGAYGSSFRKVVLAWKRHSCMEIKFLYHATPTLMQNKINLYKAKENIHQRLIINGSMNLCRQPTLTFDLQ